MNSAVPISIWAAAVVAAAANCLILGALVASVAARHADAVIEAVMNGQSGSPDDRSLRKVADSGKQVLSGATSLGSPDGQDLIAGRLLNLLSHAQRVAWDSAGKPDIESWDGRNFDVWLERQVE